VTVFGQNTNIVLPNSGHSLQDILPANWTVLAQTAGDLNNDNIQDLAIVIKNTDPKYFKAVNVSSADSMDTNPRILAIYFGESGGSGYRKALQSNTFIFHKSMQNMAEPFNGIHITDDQQLEVMFAIWFMAGSWSRDIHTYGFRYQNEAFELHNYEHTEVHRASGDLRITRVNFEMGEMEIENGHISSDEPESLETERFDLTTLKTLENLKKPFEWEFRDMDI